MKNSKDFPEGHSVPYLGKTRGQEIIGVVVVVVTFSFFGRFLKQIRPKYRPFEFSNVSQYLNLRLLSVANPSRVEIGSWSLFRSVS